MFHRMIFNRLNGQSTKQLKALLAAAILGFIIVFLMTYVVKAQDTTPLHEHPTVLTMLKTSNKIRAEKNLAPHVINDSLCRAAQNQAEYMAKHQEMSHTTNRGYKQRSIDAGYKGKVRENIAYGYISINGVFHAWVMSGVHYDAIMSETKNAGFGLAYARNGTDYWVGVYGY